jgi:hypothetical protein
MHDRALHHLQVCRTCLSCAGDNEAVVPSASRRDIHSGMSFVCRLHGLVSQLSAADTFVTFPRHFGCSPFCRNLAAAVSSSMHVLLAHSACFMLLEHLL